MTDATGYQGWRDREGVGGAGGTDGIGGLTMQMGLFDEPTLHPQRKPQSYRVAPTGGRVVTFRGWLVLEENDYGCPAGGWVTHTVSREYMTDRGGFVFEEERHEAHGDCSGEHLVFRSVELQEAPQ